MFVRILSVTLVLLSLCFQPSEGNRRLPSRKFPPPPCCTEVSADNVSSDVTRDTYRQQAAKSPCVDAIILTTHHGLVCVDPDAEWVKKLTANMRKL